jgi:hypothetical protein
LKFQGGALSGFRGEIAEARPTFFSKSNSSYLSNCSPLLVIAIVAVEVAGAAWSKRVAWLIDRSGLLGWLWGRHLHGLVGGMNAVGIAYRANHAGGLLIR